MDSQKFKELYKLSDFQPIFDTKKRMYNTQFGKLFNSKATQLLGYSVILSNCFFNDKNITIYIAIEEHLNSSHRMEFYNENNCLDIKNLVCQKVWRAWDDSITEYGLPKFYMFNENEGIPKTIGFTLYIFDFFHKARLNCFSLYANSINELSRNKFDKVSFMIRIKDDDNELYYLIFDNETELQKANQFYGISSIIDYVHEICKQNDIYHAFDDYCPKPEITTKDIIQQKGLTMAIMRDNPQFTKW